MLRPRAIALAAACALTFLLATPGSASAIAGDFYYTYTDANGTEHRQKLSNTDFDERNCLNVKEAEAEGTKPAHSPRNNTDIKTYVFEDIDCEGTYHVLKLGGGEGGVNLKFRSFLMQDS
ncbi:hypothetical protein [Streptomyces flavofungini]|uniref:hypothetical protein n=1 Tax=Streptomyces flavofungini TaxID=68200 RepID=UPI0025B00BCF|nr:hypothetical protein [Streptomyces flavofungini]WJV45612.1 hypothetical protein QUY26_08740 [Streptomyces flavofungini]